MDLTMQSKWFGRRLSKDPRDKQHLVKPDHKAAQEIRKRIWRWGLPLLDQGPTPRCVGFSAYELLRCSPIRNKPKLTPNDIYKGARQNDEWEGEDYEGSSVRGAMKFLQGEGYIGAYKWAANHEDAVSYILTCGPMQVGTNWFQGMDEPDSNGYIWPKGGKPSGHAYLLIGADIDRHNPDGSKGMVTMLNSWGKWGRTGRASLTFNSLEQLIAEDGEASVATEIMRAGL
jgi:hypothetical protein